MKSTVLISGWAHDAAPLAALAARLELAAPVRIVTLADLAAAAIGREGPATPALAVGLERILADMATPVTLIGWSTGAMLALEAALAAPARVDRLVLLSATARFCATDDYACGTDPAVLRAMLKGVRRGDTTAVLTQFLSRAAAPESLAAEFLQRQVDAAMNQGAAVLAAGLDFLLTCDLRSRLPQNSRPALLLHGMEDGIVPLAAAEWLQARLPHSRLLPLAGQGHRLPEQAPDTALVEIRRFLQGG